MNDGSLAGTLVRLVLSLTMVLTLMLILARYLRHRQNGGSLASVGSSRRKTALPLQVLTRQGLSRGSSVAVVRVSGRLLLLGVTDSTVSLLRELDDEDEPELAPEGPVPAPARGLSDVHDVVVSAVENLRRRTVRRG